MLTERATAFPFAKFNLLRFLIVFCFVHVVALNVNNMKD